MKKIIKKINSDLDVSMYLNYVTNESVLFFDIETTGFVASNCILYAIGCIYYIDNSWFFVQYFAETKDDELEILLNFFILCQKFKYTINFNGDTFDIPFISKKSISLGIDYSPLTRLISIDIFKIVKKFKSVLSLENVKQKTLEKFLNLHREDTYSGGDLIDQYYSYLKNKSKSLEYNLMLHNEEDLYGMLKLLEIFNYINIFENLKNLKLTDLLTIEKHEKFIFIVVKSKISFNKQFSFYIDSWKFECDYLNQNINICIPIAYENLNHYLSNYKDYYLHTDTSEIIHKSVAQFLDSSKKVKAIKDSCFIAKTDSYVDVISSDDFKNFKVNLKSKKNYISVSDFLSNNLFILESISNKITKA